MNLERERVFEVYHFFRTPDGRLPGIKLAEDGLYHMFRREYKSKFSETEIGKKFIGKKIIDLFFGKNELKIYFSSPSKTYLLIKDQNQQCCENRYFASDDDLDKELIGKELRDIEIKSVRSSDCEDYDYQECAFLEIKTDQGFVIIKSYLEYDNDYGGLELSIIEISQEDKFSDELEMFRKYMGSVING